MNDLVVKDNDVIRACYQLSLNEQRLLLIAIASLPKIIDEDIPFSYYEERMYDVCVDDFVKLGVHPKTAYRELEVAVERLYHRSIVIKSYGRELKTRWVQTIIKLEEPPLDEYGHKDGFIGVSLRFSYELLPFLVQLSENFTQYPLKDVAGFSSIYSIRMYELMMQFNSTKYVKIKLSELRSMFELQDKYANSKDLRKWVIETAFKEINEKSPVLADYKLIKTGKRFTHLEIFFKNKSKKSDKKSNTLDMFVPMTDNQRLSFASKLSKLPELSYLATGSAGQSYDVFAQKIAEELADKEKQKKYITHLEKLGFKGLPQKTEKIVR